MLKDIRPIGRQWGYDPHDEVVDGWLEFQTWRSCC